MLSPAKVIDGREGDSESDKVEGTERQRDRGTERQRETTSKKTTARETERLAERQSNTLQRAAICSFSLQGHHACCSALQCVAVCCTRTCKYLLGCLVAGSLHCVARRCSVSQCVSVIKHKTYKTNKKGAKKEIVEGKERNSRGKRKDGWGGGKKRGRGRKDDSPKGLGGAGGSTPPTNLHDPTSTSRWMLYL